MEFFLKDHTQRKVIAVYGTHIGMMYWHPGYRNFKTYLEADEIPDDLAKLLTAATGIHMEVHALNA